MNIVCSGDFSNLGKPAEVAEFNEWLASLSHRHKIVIAGNHDLTFDIANFDSKLAPRFFPRRDPDSPIIDAVKVKAMLTACTYLEDSEALVEGYKIYGSPVSLTTEFQSKCFRYVLQSKIVCCLSFIQWQPWFYDWGFNLERCVSREQISCSYLIVYFLIELCRPC